MHDPLTVAHEIKYPWRQTPTKFSPEGYRDTFITVWHKDPECGGSDDSCGWFTPRLTAKELEDIKREVKFEIKYWFNETPFGLAPKVSAEAIVYQAFQMIAWRLWRKEVKPQWLPHIHSLTYNHIDNFADGFRRPKLDVDDVTRSCFFIARSLKRLMRPWYRHPRWHIWHWRIQIHPWQKFRRWAFDRCHFCKGRFAWGECPTGNWSGTAIWHNRCDHHTHVKREPEEPPCA
jgi:hypothetical protein